MNGLTEKDGRRAGRKALYDCVACESDNCFIEEDTIRDRRVVLLLRTDQPSSGKKLTDETEVRVLVEMTVRDIMRAAIAKIVGNNSVMVKRYRQENRQEDCRQNNGRYPSSDHQVTTELRHKYIPF